MTFRIISVSVLCSFSLFFSSVKGADIDYHPENLVPEEVSDCSAFSGGEWYLSWDGQGTISASGHDGLWSRVIYSADQGLGSCYLILPYTILSTDVAFRLNWWAGVDTDSIGSQQHVSLFWTDLENGTTDYARINADIANNVIAQDNSLLLIDDWVNYTISGLVDGESRAGKYIGIALNLSSSDPAAFAYFDQFVVNNGFVIPEPSSYAMLLGMAGLGCMLINRRRK